MGLRANGARISCRQHVCLTLLVYLKGLTFKLSLYRYFGPMCVYIYIECVTACSVLFSVYIYVYIYMVYIYIYGNTPHELYMIPVRPSLPPPPPPQWFLPTPLPVVWCGVVVGCFPPPALWCVVWLWVASPLPLVWCGSGVGFGGSPPSPPCGVVWVGWFPPACWICLRCLANPCS